MKIHLLLEKTAFAKLWGVENLLTMACGYKMPVGREAAPRITVRTKEVTCKRCLSSREYKDWLKETTYLLESQKLKTPE